MKAKRSAVQACLLILAAATVAAALGGSATSAPATAATPSGGYSWPIAPFDQEHPVRAAVGDPRTIFRSSGHGEPLGGASTFSFHNGVDIDAPNGTPVYPVVSGFVREVRDEGVVAQADDGRLFMYMHIIPAVDQGARLTARETVLGHVENWAHELHFSELTPSGSAVNALQPGHLTPYRDTTVPTVAGLHLRDPRGNRLAPFALHGRITVIAEASDLPTWVPVRGSETFQLSKFARDRFPVTPAMLTWSLSTVGGRVVVAPQTVVDFRRTIPSDESFWRVYARGTYQNRSVIGARLHWLLPGRFLFKLTRSPLDTRRLANGVYVATVTAVDVSGNRSSLSERIEIWNARNAH
jgi:hypothetical protein